MEQILKDALFLANVCDTLQISGYIKQELFDEHAALVENINETIARVFKYAAEQNAHLTPESLASSQAVFNASAIPQSDGDTPPAQAQVA
jgi:hypothetical protein